MPCVDGSPGRSRRGSSHAPRIPSRSTPPRKPQRLIWLLLFGFVLGLAGGVLLSQLHGRRRGNGAG